MLNNNAIEANAKPKNIDDIQRSTPENRCHSSHDISERGQKLRIRVVKIAPPKGYKFSTILLI